jgi:hypothetical protein
MAERAPVWSSLRHRLADSRSRVADVDRSELQDQGVVSFEDFSTRTSNSPRSGFSGSNGIHRALKGGSGNTLGRRTFLTQRHFAGGTVDPDDRAVVRRRKGPGSIGSLVGRARRAQTRSRCEKLVRERRLPDPTRSLNAEG